MKKHYPWLWFDADNTLFDYNKAEDTALVKALQIHNLPFEEGYKTTYQRINQGLWQALERKEIRPEVLRVRRFEMFLEAAGQGVDIAEEISRVYIEQLALCTDMIDGALEVLQTLQKTSKFALITNGLTAVQRSRLSLSPIEHFFSAVIISEEIGAAKPHADFFNIAHERTGFPPKDEILVIGDSLSSDMRGGVDFGVDTCWFNPRGEARPGNLPITYEIDRLTALLDLLAWQ